MEIKAELFLGVMVTMGNSEHLYRSKRQARNKIAWRLLYDTDRLDSAKYRFDPGSISYLKGWARKRMECECSDCVEDEYGIYKGVFSESCPLHNRHNGYYKRLHKRIVRWLELGYIAPESGLKELRNA